MAEIDIVDTTGTGQPILTGRSPDIGKLVEALAAVQEHATVVEASETATVVGENKQGDRISYDYDYAPLDKVTEAVMPLLGKNGLAFVAWTQYTERGFALVYQLLHTSGQWIGGEWTLPRAKPQVVGSEITYARRYCLQTLTGVAAKAKEGGKHVDDDGRLASETYDYGSGGYEAPRRETRQAPPPSPLLVQFGYLKQAVLERGLPEDEVPAAFQARYGKPINHATPEEIQTYIDHVQATGSLTAPVDEFDTGLPAPEDEPPAPERQEPPGQARQEPPEPQRQEPPEQVRQEPSGTES